MARIGWQGVFPAVTTQFREDFSVDYAATQRVIEALIRDGVSGLIICGTVGEGTSLSADEKRKILAAAVEVAAKRVPVISGVAEYTTAMAGDLARDCQKIGVDGLMVMPAMVYSAKPAETVAHFRSVAKASDLPIMIYNNPPIYKTDVTPAMLAELADCETVVCIKESSGATARFTDIRNTMGDRLVLFCGLDDVVVESIMLGCVGWVSGMSNAFPQEGNRLFALAAAGRYNEVKPLYDWFMPLLHLDARPDLVQCIKLCEQIMGRGSERTRPPRLPLAGGERAYVERVMAEALRTRPSLRLAAE
ncbi:MAG: dihydrodipicolinate synthase family protein [Alphaproteobacteria bacterium RIFCSPHIGHO2_12_FULL_66_14]|jgi:4-hydroxy-tetrahydrodipicolinate synthase|nr:MAG: dihydrodipicolinate synthase family protein [Alphaproteobacteria bacterium RIFCSPHIGHO2_12_FULL_66_14]